MASLTTDITTEFILYRDMANHHANSVGNLWLDLVDKTSQQHTAMRKIVNSQKSLATKLGALHTSLQETSDKLTQAILEQQSQLPPPDSPLPNITIENFYQGQDQPENTVDLATTSDSVNPTEPTFEGTQQQ